MDIMLQEYSADERRVGRKDGRGGRDWYADEWRERKRGRLTEAGSSLSLLLSFRPRDSKIKGDATITRIHHSNNPKFVNVIHIDLQEQFEGSKKDLSKKNSIGDLISIMRCKQLHIQKKCIWNL